MPEVVVTIANRPFRMACEAGEEERLIALGRDLDGRITTLRERFGQIGDGRLTVMAALMLIDELGEVAEKLRRSQQERAAIEEARAQSSERRRVTEQAVLAAFSSAAERIEALTRKLQSGAGGGRS